MNADRYQKIKQIFNRSADLTVAEREEFLNQACDDSEMRREIEKMLAFTDSPDDTLEKNAFEVVTNGKHAKIPERIGEYKILREIGRGGMGAVYEAVRESENFTQRVALKVIKRGMDTDAILSRFRVEQKILASLEHPNIARFLDGGMTVDGLPFYAMEYVEGMSVNEYAAEKKLSIDERLKLFREVCAAVQYAHQNLVVHRDLKPKNILVANDGTPKLLDFGIGKILTPESEHEIGTATALGMMTPAYASPEQILGQRIGTASDVYSLGVILYELLTGQKPYRVSTKSQIEIERAILESEPVRPSARISDSRKTASKDGQTSRLSSETNPKSKIQNPKSLKGDLDTIVLKALRKEPENRYASALEFSEDIRRYLEGLPIHARPLTFFYRASKFVKRNRFGVAAAMLIFLSLCAGITVAVWQANRAERQRILAEKRFAEVRRIANNVVFKYTDAITNLPNSSAVREMLLQDASDYLDRLAQDARGDAALQRELAAAYSKLSDLQGAPYGESAGNVEKATENIRKALAIEEAILAADPRDAETRRSIITTYTKLGDLTYLQADAAETQNAYRQAENLLKELLAREPDNAALLRHLARLQMQMGSHASESVLDMQTAREFQRQALENANRLLALTPDDAAVKSLTATAHARLGMLIGHPDYSESDDLTGALENFRKSLELRRQIAQADAQSVAPRRQLAMILISEGDILTAQGNYADALKSYGESRAIFEELFKRDANDFFSEGGLAMVLSKTGAAFSLNGQTAQSFEKFVAAGKMYELFVAAKKGNVSIKNTFVAHLLDHGEALMREKRFAEAEKIYRRASEIQSEIKAEAKGFRILEINDSIISAALGTAQVENGQNPVEAKTNLEQGLTRLRELKQNRALFRRYDNLYDRAEAALQKIQKP